MRRIIVAIIGVSVFTISGAAGPISHAITDRVAALNRGSVLLDDGRNEEAAAFFEQLFRSNPALVEAADGLIEARIRQCNFDRAERYIRSVPVDTSGAAVRPLERYLHASRLNRDRMFGEAAAVFREAAAAARSAGDTLSAVICLLRAAQGYNGAREADPARESAAEAFGLASAWPAADRIAAECIAVTGEAENLSDRIESADSLYRDALRTARAGGYRRVTGYCLNGLGKLAEKRQDIEGAAAFYRDALAEMRILRSRERTAALLNNLGQAETHLRNFDAARDRLNEAREIAESCSAGWLLGYVFYGLGAIAELRGEHHEALELFERSYVNHDELGNEWGALGARQRLGYNLVELGEYPRAIEQYTHCAEAYERMGSLYGLSWTLGGLALANHRLGDFAAAEDLYLKTLDVRKRLGDRRGAAWCLNSLGMVYDLQGRYREALAKEYEALALYEGLDDRRGIGAVHFSIGSVFFYLGNFEKSLEHYKTARSLAEECGDDGLRHRVVSGMGSVYAAAGRLDLAEQLYRQDLGGTRGSGDQWKEAWARKNLASVLIETGKPDEARELLEDARWMLSLHGEDHIRAWIFYYLGRLEESDVDAIDLLHRASNLAESRGLDELGWRCLSELGERHVAAGHKSEGMTYQARAIDVVERIRRRIGHNELRLHTLRRSLLPYERMVSGFAGSPGEGGDPVRAFDYAERSKAQILAALLLEAFKRSSAGGDSLIDRERGILSKLTYLQSRLQDGSLASEGHLRLGRDIKRLERELLGIQLKLWIDRDVFQVAYPDFNRPFDLLSRLGTGETALVYFLGTIESFLFVAQRDSVAMHRLPPRTEVEKRVDLFLRLLRQPLDNYSDASPGNGPGAGSDRGIILPRTVVETASAELFDLLLGPTRGALDGAETIVIVPDGMLNRLPFAMLRDGDRYIVEDHALFLTPSIRSLAFIRDREFDPGGTAGKHTYPIITVGSKGSDVSSDARRVYPYTRIPVEPLIFAEREAREIASLFPRSLVLTGADASERSLKAGPLGDAGILHIASHCYIDDADVRRSFIVLDPEKSFADTVAGSFEDGLLQWHEIAALELDESLVTLSACRSAGGVLAYGEGITGLTHAFITAGAECVLASQIDLPDRITHRFMVAFYRHLRGGVSAAAALRETQLEAMGWSDAGTAPALWASFVLVGDGNVAVTER